MVGPAVVGNSAAQMERLRTQGSQLFSVWSLRHLRNKGVVFCFSSKKGIGVRKPDSSGLPEGLLGRPYETATMREERASACFPLGFSRRREGS